MKRTTLLSLAVFAFAACGSSTTPSGGTTTNSSGGSSSSGSSTTTGSGNGSSGSQGGSSSSGGASGCAGDTNGGVTVTLKSVGVHPAALAALAAVNLTAPTLAGTYSVELQGVALVNGAPSITTIDTQALTAANVNGPITFCNEQIPSGVASLGLIAAIVNPAAGTTPPTLPTCAQVSAGGGGFTDVYVGAASQLIFGAAADVSDGAAFALPASYVSILDCAAGYTPGSASTPDLLSQGFALLYVSTLAAGGGSPLSGVTFDDNGDGNLLYYPAGYGAGTAVSSLTSTDTNGVATITGVTAVASVSASASGVAAFKAPRHVGTSANGAYQVFYAPGT